MVKFRSPYIVLSSPSGGGKTTIARVLAKRYMNLVKSISATTRPNRPNEADGRDYYFMTEQDFMKEVRAGNFLEYEEVHGYYYGTLKRVVREITDQGKTVIFDIDVKGALHIKTMYPEAVLIFLKVLSESELIRRLQQRKSETQASINLRLQRLPFEYSQAGKFDHVVMNHDLHTTIEQIEALIIKNDK